MYSRIVYSQFHVSVLQRTAKIKELQNLYQALHKHVVNFLKIFNIDGTIYYVYEYMDISLRNIASLKACLKYFDLNLMCKIINQ